MEEGKEIGIVDVAAGYQAGVIGEGYHLDGGQIDAELPGLDDGRMRGIDL